MHSALTRSLAHQEIQRSEIAVDDADLTIDVFECPLPPFSLTLDQWHQAALLHKPARMLGASPFIHVDAIDSRLSLLSWKDKRAVVGLRDAARIPPWDRATPFREVFNAWFQKLHGQLIHGAIVGNETSAVLLTGRGGTGKSNSALACLPHDGLKYLGDDLCLVRQQSSEWIGHCLYNSTKLLPHDVRQFADFIHKISNASIANGKKRVYFLYPEYRAKIADCRPLRAIFLPKICPGADTRLTPASSAEAFRAMVPMTQSLVPCHPGTALQWSSAFVKALPAFHLELGTDRREVAAVIHRFLSEENSCQLRQSA